MALLLVVVPSQLCWSTRRCGKVAARAAGQAWQAGLALLLHLLLLLTGCYFQFQILCAAITGLITIINAVTSFCDFPGKAERHYLALKDFGRASSQHLMLMHNSRVLCCTGNIQRDLLTYLTATHPDTLNEVLRKRLNAH